MFSSQTSVLIYSVTSPPWGAWQTFFYPLPFDLCIFLTCYWHSARCFGTIWAIEWTMSNSQGAWSKGCLICDGVTCFLCQRDLMQMTGTITSYGTCKKKMTVVQSSANPFRDTTSAWTRGVRWQNVRFSLFLSIRIYCFGLFKSWTNPESYVCISSFQEFHHSIHE
jgi:hypothetical protein